MNNFIKGSGEYPLLLRIGFFLLAAVFGISGIMSLISWIRYPNDNIGSLISALFFAVLSFILVYMPIMSVTKARRKKAEEAGIQIDKSKNLTSQLMKGNIKINGGMIGGLITMIIGIILVVGGLILAFAAERVFLGAFLITLGIVIVFIGYMIFMGGFTESRNKVIEGNQANQENIDIINRILEEDNINSMLEKEFYFDKGLKMVVLGKQSSFELIMLKDFAYDGLLGGYYDYLVEDYRKLQFKIGSEITITQTYQVDVGKSARQGLFVGGLGVAALNAADAMEANANGGRKVSVGSGHYPITFDVSNASCTPIYYVMISKDIVEKFGVILEECRVKKGEYFNLYEINTYKKATADTITERLNKVVENITFNR